jgi:hypothetical protein
VPTDRPIRSVLRGRCGLAAAASAALTLLATTALPTQAGAAGAFLGGLRSGSPASVTTVPGNGDINPYGVAVVSIPSVGALVHGSVLVSNFNDAANNQGTGTTIVELPAGAAGLTSATAPVFATIAPTSSPANQCPGGIGLTTALAVLPGGWVVVGSLPTQAGMLSAADRGCLLVINAMGHVASVITGHHLNGPWDMTATSSGDDAALFVTNVLNGTVAAAGGVVDRGTVVRLDLRLHDHQAPTVRDATVIGSGFAERTDPAALVVGPTGVGLSPDRRTLYVADTASNRIAAIANPLTRHSTASSGKDVFAGAPLNNPLGLATAPNGDIITVNGNDGNAVETAPNGAQVATRTLDNQGSPAGAGDLFGLAIGVPGTPQAGGLYFVDDFNTPGPGANSNSLNFQAPSP